MTEAASTPSLEIERKWLVSSLPDLSDSQGQKIHQGYIVVTPDIEVRLRSIDDSHFFQTVKTGEGLVRAEYEIELTREQFSALWPTTGARVISKVRHSILNIDDSGIVVELDIYDGKLTGLRTIEVEFPNLVAAHQFNAPDWFGEEITQDSRYKNKNLALKGLPE